MRRRAPLGATIEMSASASIGQQHRSVEVVSRRRGQILDVAAKAFSQRGVGNTTMRDIATAAGILPGSLYHHFESKDALLEEILRGALSDLTQAYDEVSEAHLDARSAVENLLLVGLHFVAAHHDVACIVQNDFAYLHDVETFAFVDEFAELHGRSWQTVLERGVAAEILRADLDLGVVYRSLMASIVSEVRWRHDGCQRPDATHLAGQYARLYLVGLAADSRDR